MITLPVRLPAAAASLVLLMATALPAQRAGTDFPSLAVGQTVRGELTRSDPATLQRGHFHVYRVTLDAGRRYTVGMDSDDFDAYLVLARPVGGITESIREDDDGGEGFNSRLSFVAPAPGVFLLVAQALSGDETGSYTLSFDTLPPAIVRPISIGQTVRGEFTDRDRSAWVEDGVSHLLSFEGAAGQRLRARTDGDDMSASIEFGRLVAGEFQPLEEATYSMSSTMATLPAGGTYHLRVSSWAPESYALTLEERVIRPATPVALSRGAGVAGVLSADAPELEDGRAADTYTFVARSGEQLTITMESDSFDTYLILGRMEGGTFVELDRNDDGEHEEDGLNSRIVFTVPSAGTYTLQATSFGGGREGPYTVRVSP
jgi:hypothetical protein